MTTTVRKLGWTLGAAALSALIASHATAAETQKKTMTHATKPAPATKVDLNTATEKELEGLPGVGAATAKKIVAGRPYASASDLSKAGVPANTIKEITPMVTVGTATAPAAAAAPAATAPKGHHGKKAAASTAAHAAAAAPATAPAPAAPSATAAAATTAAAPAATAKAAKPAPAAQPVPPAGSGQVWVNLESKVYHREGDQWYGKTKNGKFMSEADAIKAGYRASKTGADKKPAN